MIQKRKENTHSHEVSFLYGGDKICKYMVLKIKEEIKWGTGLLDERGAVAEI